MVATNISKIGKIKDYKKRVLLSHITSEKYLLLKCNKNKKESTAHHLGSFKDRRSNLFIRDAKLCV